MGTNSRSLLIRVAAISGVLTYGVGLWLVLLHSAEGHAGGEHPIALHWLRDSTLALPAVALASWLALSIAARALRRAPGAPSALGLCVPAAAVAVAACVAMAAGSPVQSALFGTHEAHGLSPIAHVLRDAALGLVVALPLAAALLALLSYARRPSVPLGRLAPRVALGALALAVLVAFPAPSEQAGEGPGMPCPTGAPLKTFDVRAIDVDITLNRFGDHDPQGKMYVLSKDLAAVRAQEQSRRVSIGLRDDAIQPLVIRANQGDCVELSFTNNASGGVYGVHIDGLAFENGSSGDAIGNNVSSAVGAGASTLYRYYVPKDPTLEGAHYLHPGPGNRNAVSHGLFGTLVVEPEGSTYLHATTRAPIDSGWEAVIAPGIGKSFREGVKIYHEVGDEQYQILDAAGAPVRMTDPHTEAYRPGTRALNYRSEPFMRRLELDDRQKSQGYGSYTFGDPATPIPRGYLGDPTKFRVLQAGSEMFHVHHLHGGGDRWRFNPHADKTYDYADTGLNKKPKTQLSPSTRLDSQSIGPGESYDLQIEGGAGGVQQAAGDFLWHCHIAEHYIAGMWSFWRVFDTRQSDLAPLPDRAAPLDAVDSAGLIGKTMPDGTTITPANLDSWIRPQLPPQGVRQSEMDAAVWNWTTSAGIYLGEPEATGTWPNLPNVVPGHPGSLLGDQLVGNRPKIMFNPTNGRPAWPLLRPHPGLRPPFSPNGHSGAPWLGEDGERTPSAGPDPWAARADGLCPKASPLRRYNVVAIQTPIQVTPAAGIAGTDPFGKLFVLAKNKADVLAGTKPKEPLAIRGNIGDCIGLTLTSEQRADAEAPFPKVNMHVHHVQFDPQGSDGVISGLSYEQSVRPYKLEDPSLTAAASSGSSTLSLSSVAKFQPGVWIGIGLGTEAIEVRQIASIDTLAGTVTLTRPLSSAHAAGEWAGTEFVQYRWYPDVALDNVFWHDHVDGIHAWGHGLVGQLLVEPPGSTYHDPETGAEGDGSGNLVDIRTPNALAPGIVDGSFRELALLTINDNPVADSTLNLRAEPWARRLADNPDPSLLFSSYTHGDPITPMLRAYPGDPFVIRAINSGPTMDTVHVDGHRFYLENRYLDENGKVEATPVDTIHYGVSERFSLMSDGGAGGPQKKPGDYLYMNGLGQRFREGAWGIVRVLEGRVADLQPLPGTNPGGTGDLPDPTGGRPPAASGPGEPCPAGAPPRSFNVSAVPVGPGAAREGASMAFVPSSEAAAVMLGTRRPEPLVLHAATGDCITVNFTNRANERASFHVSELLRDPASSGVNAGFNREQTVALGASRTYRFYADSERIGSAAISDFGGNSAEVDPDTGAIEPNVDTGPQGLYGAIVVAPAGATFTDPVTGTAKDVGAQVDVHVPGQTGYRDFTLLFSEQDEIIGTSASAYPRTVRGPALVNYGSAPRPDDTGAAFATHSGTPLLRAYRTDPVKVHALVAPGTEQVHVFNLGGLSWPLDPFIHEGQTIQNRGIGPWESLDAHILGGAGGSLGALGDYFYGDARRPFTQAGMWGLQRVLSDPTCPIQPVDGRTCIGGPIPAAPSKPDLTAASDTGVSSADEITNDTTPTLVGTAEPGVTVTLLVDGAVKGTGAADAGGAYSITTGGLPAGAHAVSAKASVDSTGRGGTSEPLAITIDTTAPTSVARLPNFIRLRTLGVTIAPVVIQWAATDAASGVAEFGLQESTTGGASYTDVPLPTPLSESIVRDLVHDGVTTYRYRSRAMDVAGNWSGFASSIAFTLTTRQQTDAAISYAGDWRTEARTDASGRSLTWASVAGAKATFTFTGRRAAWIAPLGPAGGRAEVWLDGARVATIDLYSAVARARRFVDVRGVTPSVPHTLEIRVLGTKNARSTSTRVDLDAFVVLG